jgi:hypothetical protein
MDDRDDRLRDAWNQVADGFATLGRAMRERYQEGEARPAASGEEVGAAGEALRDAFERLVAAGRDVGQRAVDVLRDRDVNSQAKQAAMSLNDALSATVDLIGREVGGLFRREPSGSDAVTGDDPAVVGVPDEVPDAVRPSATGLVTGPVDGETDVTIADVDAGERGSTSSDPSS